MESTLEHELVHEGIIESYAKGLAKVRILAEGSCESCKIGAGCAAASKGTAGRVLQVPCETELKRGDHVRLIMGRRSELKASLLVFILPVLLVFGVLLGGTALGLSQSLAAAAGLGSFVLYLIVLIAAKKRVARQFSVRIEPLGLDGSSALVCPHPLYADDSSLRSNQGA